MLKGVSSGFKMFFYFFVYDDFLSCFGLKIVQVYDF